MWPFKTNEVNLLLATMETLAPAFEPNLGAFDEVRKRAEKAITANPDLARQALVEQNRPPKEICLTLLVNIVKGDLLSGEERHAWAPLTLTLTGTQWMSIYHIAMKELVKIGILNEDDRRLNETEFKRELSERFG